MNTLMAIVTLWIVLVIYFSWQEHFYNPKPKQKPKQKFKVKDDTLLVVDDCRGRFLCDYGHMPNMLMVNDIQEEQYRREFCRLLGLKGEAKELYGLKIVGSSKILPNHITVTSQREWEKN